MFMHKSTFESIGGFSEDYFMYSEDVDLCHKAADAGVQNYCVTSARIIHYGGGSSAQQSARQFASVMLRESRWRYFKKTRGIAYAILFRTILLLAAVIRWSLVRLPLPGGSVEGRLARKTACEKWLAIAQWCVGSGLLSDSINCSE